MLNLVVALPAEARPLISHYGLQALDLPGDFRVYASRDLHLIRSGPGKKAAGEAIEYLHLLRPETGAWLNLGVAGHGLNPVGTPLLVDRIVDQRTARSYYPVFTFPPPCATTALLTVDAPEEDYAGPWAYDMEASGFFAASSRFSPPERIHCLKIVSDGPRSSHRRISKKTAQELVAGHLGLIDELTRTLGSLASCP